MHRDIPVLGHRQSLDQALRILQGSGLPAIGVMDGSGRLIGLVTPENLGEMMMIQAAQSRHRRRNP